MPSRRPRRHRRTRRTRRRGLSTRAIAVRALASTDQELKAIDFNTAPNALAIPENAPLFFALNTVAEGNTLDSRIGKQLKMRSIQIMMKFSLPASQNTTQFRGQLMLDKQPNGAIATAASVFTDATQFTYLSPLNLNNRRRFKILKSFRVVLDLANVSTRIVTLFKRVPMKTTYNAAGGGSGQINTNSLFIVFTSDQPAGNSGTVEIYARLRFVG